VRGRRGPGSARSAPRYHLACRSSPSARSGHPGGDHFGGTPAGDRSGPAV